MGKKSKIIVSLIVVVIVAAALAFWLQYKKTPPSQQTSSKNLGGQIYEKVQNPLEGKLPETNPFNKLYKNPFE